jgi:SAM-dependent methyltransferase
MSEGVQTTARRAAVSGERAYDGLGERFEVVMNRFDLERRLDLILARVPPDGGGAALEVGCGLGYLSERLRRDRGLRPVSLDIAGSLLRLARERGRVSAPVQGSALALPFASASMNVVLSTECIEHTPDPRAAVREMLRVMRPGATLVLTCPNAAWHWAVRGANWLGMRPYDGLENWPGFGELRSWLDAEGAEVIEHVGFHALPFQLPLARRWLPVLDRVILGVAPALAVNQLVVARKP